MRVVERGADRLVAHPWVLAALASAISLAFLLVLPSQMSVNESADYRFAYEPMAHQLLAGHGFLDENGVASIRYPPGYPVLLAAAFALGHGVGVSETTAALALNLVATGAGSLLVFLLAAPLWGRRLALIPWAAWSTYPLALYLLKQPNSEVPFIVLMIGALVCLAPLAVGDDIGPGRAAACGVLIGAAMLVRPIAIGLGIVFALLVALARARWRVRLAAVLLAANVLTVLPWELWLYQQTGGFVALSSAGPAALRDGLTFAVRMKGFRSGTWVPDDVRTVMTNISNEYPRLRTSGAVVEVLAREFRRDPIAVTKLLMLKAARSWYGTDSQRFEGAILALQCLYLAAIVLATVAAWMSGSRGRAMVVCAWTIALYFWGMTIISSSLVRYMVPPTALLFILLPALGRWWPGLAASRRPALD